MKKTLLYILIFSTGIAFSQIISLNELSLSLLQSDTIENDNPLSNATTTDLSSKETNSFAKIFSTEGSFEDVKDDLLESIGDNGLVISYTSHARSMLENTAAVAGVTTPVYDEAEIILFCKASLSHTLVAENPHNLILCPYAIGIYVLHKEPNKVYLSFREPPENTPATKPIRELLVRIIDDVI